MNKLLLLFSLLSIAILPQAKDSMDVFIIESFADYEYGNLKISFFTERPVISLVRIDNSKNYPVSMEYSENHNFEIPIDSINPKKQVIPFSLILTDSTGKTYNMGPYELEVNAIPEVEERSNLLTLCLFGGMVFGIPSPSYAFSKEENSFSLTKDIPLIFIRSTDNIGYPFGYFSVEYTYIFNNRIKNILRAGYKHIIEIPGIEFISPGITGFTNFYGFNGIGGEVSLGLFEVYDVFTIYSRYRYNWQPNKTINNFHEVSLGVYSGFFAIYL